MHYRKLIKRSFVVVVKKIFAPVDKWLIYSDCKSNFFVRWNYGTGEKRIRKTFKSLDSAEVYCYTSNIVGVDF